MVDRSRGSVSVAHVPCCWPPSPPGARNPVGQDLRAIPRCDASATSRRAPRPALHRRTLPNAMHLLA